jgi:recombination DNA repair RAD52 pathway protein
MLAKCIWKWEIMQQSTSINIHDIKVIIDVIDNSVIKRQPSLTSFTKNKARKQYQQHLCLDRAYHSKSVRQQIIIGHIPHIPYKRKRGQKKEIVIVNSCVNTRIHLLVKYL